MPNNKRLRIAFDANENYRRKLKSALAGEGYTITTGIMAAIVEKFPVMEEVTRELLENGSQRPSNSEES